MIVLDGREHGGETTELYTTGATVYKSLWLPEETVASADWSTVGGETAETEGDVVFSLPPTTKGLCTNKASSKLRTARNHPFTGSDSTYNAEKIAKTTIRSAPQVQKTNSADNVTETPVIRKKSNNEEDIQLPNQGGSSEFKKDGKS